jgi:hypothetical protein
MDRIIAVYGEPERAAAARTHLFHDGFAADRLDVVSWADPGRAAAGPNAEVEDNLVAHFSMLLDDEREVELVGRIVDDLRAGKAALIVHPRGQVEIERAGDLLEQHEPEVVLWRVSPPEKRGGLLGERAAGPPA